MKNRIEWVVGVVVYALIMAVIPSQASAQAKGPMQIVAEAKAKIVEITPQQVKADMDAGKPVILLDVRDPDEYKAGHLSKAINISRGRLEWNVGRRIPDRNANIVLYCRNDPRSALAAVVLKEMGYTNAKNMKGGFEAWGKAGYPIYNMHGEFTMVAFEKRQ